jgi:hypothetical protein
MITYDNENTIIEESRFFELQIEIIQAFVGISEGIFLIGSIRSIVWFMKRYVLHDNEIGISLFVYRVNCFVIEICIRSCIKDIFLFIGESFFTDNFGESYLRKKRFLFEEFKIYRADKGGSISL